MPRVKRSEWPAARAAKFRQAAFVYVHVAILYEAAAWEMMKVGLLPTRFGPPIIWLVLGGAVGGAIAWGLYRYQNLVFTRVVWAVHGLRLPALIGGAFLAESAALRPGFYLTAIVVVVINLWMLARAGWDL